MRLSVVTADGPRTSHPQPRPGVRAPTPGITGIQALRILAHDPSTAHIPVVAISANAMPRDIENGLEAGFFRYLTKPIRVREFMETLDAALALRENAVLRSA